MTFVDGWVLALAAVLVVVAGLFSSADAALSSFSKARAEELVEEGRSGGDRLLRIAEDPARYINSALLLRMLCEIAAIVLVASVVRDLVGSRWWAIVVSIAVMLVVSFVVIGVAPRTLGRQHSERVARLSAGPVLAFTRVLGPIPKLLILVGNAITPGRGF
ncbi:MAG: CNNM domain-containing protein, partial [Gaiellaceae bacterium]